MRCTPFWSVGNSARVARRRARLRRTSGGACYNGPGHHGFDQPPASAARPARLLRPVRRPLRRRDPGPGPRRARRRRSSRSSGGEPFQREWRGLLASYVGRPTPARRGPPARARDRSRRQAPRAPVAQARGPLPHRRAQDQQRARARSCSPEEDGQDAHHRRDRRRASTASRPPPRARSSACRARSTWAPRTCKRQAPNVGRMKLLGAAGHPRRERLAHAQGRHERGAARLGHERAHDPLLHRQRRRAATPTPSSSRRCRRVIGEEARAQVPGAAGRAARRGRRLRRRRLERDRPLPRLPEGRRTSRSSASRPRARASPRGKHAATLGAGRVGVLHGSKSYVLCDEGGQIQEAHSISAGLDYPGVGPEHSWLKETGRATYVSATDEEALAARARRWRAPRGSSRRSRRRTRSRASGDVARDHAARRGRPGERRRGAVGARRQGPVHAAGEDPVTPLERIDGSRRRAQGARGVPVRRRSQRRGEHRPGARMRPCGGGCRWSSACRSAIPPPTVRPSRRASQRAHRGRRRAFHARCARPSCCARSSPTSGIVVFGYYNPVFVRGEHPHGDARRRGGRRRAAASSTCPSRRAVRCARQRVAAGVGAGAAAGADEQRGAGGGGEERGDRAARCRSSTTCR